MGWVGWASWVRRVGWAGSVRGRAGRLVTIGLVGWVGERITPVLECKRQASRTAYTSLSAWGKNETTSVLLFALLTNVLVLLHNNHGFCPNI